MEVIKNMAEFTAVAQQTVEPNQVILFTDTPVRGNNSIMHRDGSGLVSLRGLTCCQPRARFRVSFGGKERVSFFKRTNLLPTSCKI